jgi:diacylglycerol kinase (ATP)
VEEDDLKPEHFPKLIRKHASRIHQVILCGGDGTLNSALPALLETQIPVLFVPSGTANNFARNHNLPEDLDKIVVLANAPPLKRIDVGLVNGLPFCTVCGLGLSSLVNKTISGIAKKWLGPAAFGMQMFKVVWNMRPFRIQLNLENQPSLELRNVYQVSVCNGRYFATGLSVTEDARTDDGELDFLIVHFKKWWHGLWYFTHFFRGTAKKLAEVTHVRAAKASLHSRRLKILDVDGDLKSRTPAHFEVAKAALIIVAPEAPAP